MQAAVKLSSVTFILNYLAQALSAVCCFENIQSAVDTVVEVMSYGIPIARIGKQKYFKFWVKYFTVSCVMVACVRTTRKYLKRGGQV